MQRRTILKGATGIGATATIGGLGLLATTGGASATAGFDYGEVTITSDDGTVQYVAIFGDSIVEWDGFDAPATEFQLVIDATLTDGDGNVVYSGQMHDTGRVALSQGDSWGGAGEKLSGEGTHGTIESNVGYKDGSQDPSMYWDVVAPNGDASQGSNSYPLPQNPVPASNLEVGTDGGTTSFTVEMEQTYTWYDSAGNEVFTKSWTSTIPVTVTNQAQTAGASAGSQTDGATGG